MFVVVGYGCAPAVPYGCEPVAVVAVVEHQSIGIDHYREVVLSL